MKKIATLILLIYLICTLPCYAEMKLYVSSNCKSCNSVIQEGKETIQQLKSKGELEVINVTDIRTDLPALPALVDENKVFVGTGLIEHLDEKLK